MSPTELSTVPVESLHPGDLVLVRPGERVAVDGAVIEGRSEIDQSLVTGETTRLPRPVAPPSTPGHSICRARCGSRSGPPRKARCWTRSTRMLERALEARSHYVRLADRAAQLYAPLVHATALCHIDWLGRSRRKLHDAIVTAIAVLIITCPCALGLAIPAVQVVASGRLFRNGVLLNSGEALERLAGGGYRPVRQDGHPHLA